MPQIFNFEEFVCFAVKEFGKDWKIGSILFGASV